MELKQHVANMTKRMAAMTNIRLRLGVDRMTDLERADLADELRAAKFTAEAILFLTDLRYGGQANAKETKL